jgi:TrmH family RNA methyltransferase
MITSRDNARLKQARALQTGKGRAQTGRMLLEGSRLVEAAWAVRATFHEVLYCPSWLTPRAEQLVARLVSEGVPGYAVAEAAFRTVAETDTPQGIVAIVSRPKATWADLSPDSPLVLAVEDLRDPGNLGTILRTAQAAGCSGVVLLGETVDVTSAKVLRAAQGALFALPVIEGPREDLIRWAQECGARLIATRADARQTLYEVDWRPGTVLLVGSEAHGLRPEWDAVVQATVRIPMRSGAESLNAAVAAAVLLYEAVRQREYS